MHDSWNSLKHPNHMTLTWAKVCIAQGLRMGNSKMFLYFAIYLQTSTIIRYENIFIACHNEEIFLVDFIL